MKTATFLLSFILAFGFSECLTERDLELFKIIKELSTVYHAKFLDFISMNRGEQSFKYSEHVKEFLAEIGIVEQQIAEKRNKTQQLINNRYLEGADPSCLKTAEANLSETSENVGQKLQIFARELLEKLQLLYDSYFYKHAVEVEQVTMEMSTELSMMFGRYNPVTKLDKMSSSVIHQLYMYMNYHDKAKARLSKEILEFEETLFKFYEVIFHEIYNELNQYIQTIQDIQNFVKSC